MFHFIDYVSFHCLCYISLFMLHFIVYVTFHCYIFHTLLLAKVAGFLLPSLFEEGERITCQPMSVGNTRSNLLQAVSYKNKPLTKNHTKKCEEGELVRIDGGIGGSTAPIAIAPTLSARLHEGSEATDPIKVSAAGIILNILKFYGVYVVLLNKSHKFAPD